MSSQSSFVREIERRNGNTTNVASLVPQPSRNARNYNCVRGWMGRLAELR